MISDRICSTSITLWSWLFPITYLLHIAEEYWGGDGYSAYLLRQKDVQLSPARFLLVQGIGMALMIAGIILARRLRFPHLLSVILGSVVLVNGLYHTVLTWEYAEYVPGLITSVLLWIPLGVATLVRLRDSMRPARYWSCVALGVAINIVVELVANNASHFF